MLLKSWPLISILLASNLYAAGSTHLLRPTDLIALRSELLTKPSAKIHQRTKDHFPAPQFTGIVEEYDSDGRLMCELAYVRGLSEGFQRWYFADESVARLYIDELGAHNGAWVAWYPNGTLHQAGKMKHGQRHGTWHLYFENGQVAAKGTYQEGHPHGAWQSFNEQGQELESCIYANGKMIQGYFRINHELTYKHYYKHLRHYLYLDKKGKAAPQGKAIPDRLQQRVTWLNQQSTPQAPKLKLWHTEAPRSIPSAFNSGSQTSLGLVLVTKERLSELEPNETSIKFLLKLIQQGDKLLLESALKTLSSFKSKHAEIYPRLQALDVNTDFARLAAVAKTLRALRKTLSKNPLPEGVALE